MAVAESKVGGIIAALSGLEDNIDTLNASLADMKRQMSILAQKETDRLYERTREMATAEAEGIIADARAKAEAEAARISEEAAAKLEKIRADIDAGFEDAVETVVSTIMKPQDG